MFSILEQLLLRCLSVNRRLGITIVPVHMEGRSAPLEQLFPSVRGLPKCAEHPLGFSVSSLGHA